MSDQRHNRRIDRILEPAFVQGLDALPIEELRGRRDDCVAEREYLSLLRRLLQGRAEILKAESEARVSGAEQAPLVERLTAILADEEHPTTSRGEAVRVVVPEEEMLLARRRVERLAADADLSDPSALDDDALATAIEALVTEEEGVSATRRQVLDVLDAVQDELKRRYKDDPTLALR
ncbi:MAG: aerial mycelium formation protein [Planctomycetaceae bacterium]